MIVQDLRILRTTSANDDFIGLVEKLDYYLAVIDGNEHDFYAQYNKISMLNHVVVIYNNAQPVGCCAFKEISKGVVEIKRMYTDESQRGKGIASLILKELETWSSELKYEKCVLETGRRMTDAVFFYTTREYKEIPNYGQYIGIDNSICFEKIL